MTSLVLFCFILCIYNTTGRRVRATSTPGAAPSTVHTSLILYFPIKRFSSKGTAVACKIFFSYKKGFGGGYGMSTKNGHFKYGVGLTNNGRLSTGNVVARIYHFWYREVK